MKTKKFYFIPDIRVIEIQSSTLLAGSNEEFGASGSVTGSENGSDEGEEWTSD